MATLKRATFEIADDDWYYDAAVSGADPIEGGEGFARLLNRIEGNGVSTVSNAIRMWSAMTREVAFHEAKRNR
jgi:hypothetical protein